MSSHVCENVLDFEVCKFIKSNYTENQILLFPQIKNSNHDSTYNTLKSSFLVKVTFSDYESSFNDMHSILNQKKSYHYCIKVLLKKEYKILT